MPRLTLLLSHFFKTKHCCADPEISLTASAPDLGPGCWFRMPSGCPGYRGGKRFGNLNHIRFIMGQKPTRKGWRFVSHLWSGSSQRRSKQCIEWVETLRKACGMTDIEKAYVENIAADRPTKQSSTFAPISGAVPPQSCATMWRGRLEDTALKYPHVGSSDARCYSPGQEDTVYRYDVNGRLPSRRILGGRRTVYSLPLIFSRGKWKGRCTENAFTGGGALPNGEGTACEDEEACWAWCRTTPRCRAFAYRRASKWCSLSHRTETIRAPGSVTRAKCPGD